MKNLILLNLFWFLLSASLAGQTHSFQTGHTHDILKVAFSPDNSELASYSAGDGRFCLWNVRSGKLLWMTKTGFLMVGNKRSNLQEFYWSENEEAIITKTADGKYQKWDRNTGKIREILEGTPDFLPIEIKGNSKFSVTKENNTLIFREGSIELKRFKAFGNNSALDLSQDGTLIAEGGRWGDACIKITEVATGRSWWLDGHPSIVGAVAFTPDGRYLAVGGGDKIIYIFDVSKKTLVKTLAGSQKPIVSITMHPNGKTLVSTETNGTARVWDLNKGTQLESVQVGDVFSKVKAVFSRDGRYVLTSDGVGIDLRNAETLEIRQRLLINERYESGDFVRFTDDSLPISSVSLNNEGSKIISTHPDGTIRIWELERQAPIRKFYVCEVPLMASLVNNDKDVLVFCDDGDGGNLKLFEVNSGKKKLKFDEDEGGFIESISISPDGRYFLTSDIGGHIHFWDMRKSKPLREYDIGFSGDDSIAFSPEGKIFAVGGRNQNLYLFNVETGEKYWQLIPSYLPSEREIQLEEKNKKVREVLNKESKERDLQAASDTKAYQDQVVIRFSHFGDMSDPGEKRMFESAAADESKEKKNADESNAVWLSLTNKSPLPIRIPTQSMYAEGRACTFKFTDQTIMRGLCDGSEVSIWHSVKDSNGKYIPFGFDFGSSEILLPNTSVLFPVPLAILANGNSIEFDYTFQKETNDHKVAVYGAPKTLRFKKTDIPK